MILNPVLLLRRRILIRSDVDYFNKMCYYNDEVILMSNFKNEDYIEILTDCVHDVFYTNTSYRGKIAQIRMYSEIIVRKLIDYPPKKQLTIGKHEILDTLEKLPYGSSFKKCVIAIKDDTANYVGANSCSHSKALQAITESDYDCIYNHFLELLSCVFVQFFSKNKFGNNPKTTRLFSLLPPIVRYYTLKMLYEEEKDNPTLIEKFALVTLKEYGEKEAIEWIESEKENLKSIPSWLGTMYEWAYSKAKSKIKATYKTMEEAKAYFEYNKKTFIKDSDSEVQDLLKLMDFVYIGRQEDKNMEPKEYVVNFYDK